MSRNAKKSKKLTPVQRLMAAMDRCAFARGEAQWTNGYRAGKGEPEASRLYPKQQVQWERCDKEENNFRRLALRLLREAKAEATSSFRRGLHDE